MKDATNYQLMAAVHDGHAKIMKGLAKLDKKLEKLQPGGIPWKVALPLGVGISFLAYQAGKGSQTKTASANEELKRMQEKLVQLVKQKKQLAEENEKLAKALDVLLKNKVNHAAKWAFLAGAGTVGGLGLGFAGGYYLGGKKERREEGWNQI